MEIAKFLEEIEKNTLDYSDCIIQKSQFVCFAMNPEHHQAVRFLRNVKVTSTGDGITFDLNRGYFDLVREIRFPFNVEEITLTIGNGPVVNTPLPMIDGDNRTIFKTPLLVTCLSLHKIIVSARCTTSKTAETLGVTVLGDILKNNASHDLTAMSQRRHIRAQLTDTTVLVYSGQGDLFTDSPRTSGGF